MIVLKYPDDREADYSKAEKLLNCNYISILLRNALNTNLTALLGPFASSIDTNCISSKKYGLYVIWVKVPYHFEADFSLTVLIDCFYPGLEKLFNTSIIYHR